MSMWKDFKAFAFKGSVVDMAVGVMIGGAFSKIVSSLVNDVFMPLIGALTNGVTDFSALFVSLDGNAYATLADAEAAGAACFKYGTFISTIIDFLLMALCVFFFVKFLTKLRSRSKPDETVPAKEPRLCPFCMSEIHDDATRCPHCTSVLEAARDTEEKK